MTMEKTIGEIIQAHRKEKGWTVKEFLKRLGVDVSPAYITKVEVHGEVPSVELICKIAAVLGLDERELFEAAKTVKINRLDGVLEKQYQQASALYRVQKKKGDG